MRKEALRCVSDRNSTKASKADGFLKLENIRVLDFAQGPCFGNTNCRTLGLENCSCIAYAYDPRIGFMFWSGDLILTFRVSHLEELIFTFVYHIQNLVCFIIFSNDF